MSSDFDKDPMPTRAEFPGEAEYIAAVQGWHERNTERAMPAINLALTEDLERWWMAKATDEIERTVPKAVEYGADDLIEIGREMVAAGVKDPGTGDVGYAELGIFFYEVGKMARWRSAVRRGEPVSDDTLFDSGVYVRMVQRVRTNGGWPGLTQEQMSKEGDQ